MFKIFSFPFKRFGPVLAVVLVALAACGTPPPDRTASTQPRESSGPAPARAKTQMVSAANPLAAQAGLDILRAGGSAVDAAIAVQMVLNVVEPQSSGIGGGGFLVHYAAKSGAIEAYDGRETAPDGASETMFLNADGTPMAFFDAVPGGLSVGVPGLLRLLELAHKEHGKLPWRKLFDPAIKIAEQGFELSPRLHQMIADDSHINKFPTASGYFLTEDGAPKPVGTKLVNKPLAETFKLIADFGPEAFYRGPVAADIVDAVRGVTLNPGSMTEEDLLSYEAKKRDPLCSLYRQWVVCGMPPPTSGGIATLQILGILQNFDLAKLKPESAEAAHLIAEASRLAFADRNVYVADSDFVFVPTAKLIDPGYLARRAKEIDRDRSMGVAHPGDLDQRAEIPYAPSATEKGVSTTHFSIIDKEGNVVSLTSSIESAFGSGLMVRGFLLNNQLTDFSFRPANEDGQPYANRVEPGKRPRSSMSPTIVFDGSGKPVLAVGSPGGSRIIGYVSQTILNVLDWGMNPQAAVSAPHVVNRNGATDLEKGTPAETLQRALEARGHEVNVRELNSGLHAIRISADGITGGADPRREGAAVGD